MTSTTYVGTKYIGAITLPVITMIATGGVYMDNIDGVITLPTLTLSSSLEPFGLTDYILEHSRARGKCA